MASDYVSIRIDNERRYGTDIGRIGPMLLANRYDDRTHFIYELLQNAEDALARRKDWTGRRAVAFDLTSAALRVSHFGTPFTEGDVRGICGIAESNKDFTSIGRFGIGFKSVYAFSDCPEVHSGEEHFAVDSFVWPRAIATDSTKPNETSFVLPMRKQDSSAVSEIAAGLRRLGPRTLLFLRQLEEISWFVEDGSSGVYLRSKPETIDQNIRKVVLVGQEKGAAVTEETWLVFSREVHSPEESMVGYVEVAFCLEEHDNEPSAIRPINDSRLVAFFPTIVPTNLGILIQGPYRTTPSRDNVPRNDSWNQYLVRETATVLVSALFSLREMALLDTGALQCLPLDSIKFGADSMFCPLFEAVRQALASEALLPRFGGGYISASSARMARTQELREIFDPKQLSDIYQTNGEIGWLSGDITQDKTPDLRRYLMQELKVTEVTPETIIPRLDKAFLEAQSDQWMEQFYSFLGGQPALVRQNRLSDIPLIRIEDGTHLAHVKDGLPQVFLPSSIVTGFPTVRRMVCGSPKALAFLQSLGLTEPDPVDDVIWHVLPKYKKDEVDVEDDEYEKDIGRILAAFATDSKGQREKLLKALRECSFVMAVDLGDNSTWFEKPGDLYIATERLKELFSGVADILLVDDAYSCLRGDDVRTLLEACGATRYLRPIQADSGFTWEEKRKLRIQSGHEHSSGHNDSFEDWSLAGFELLLRAISTLSAEAAAAKSRLLWEALGDVATRHGQSFFTGSYRWTHYGSYSSEYPSKFVRQLNETAWVPGESDQLERPEIIVFESLGWKPDPFLQSKIRFKPAIIDTLAREAGIEPGVLDLLKKHGVTSVVELTARLGLPQESKPGEVGAGSKTVGDALKSMLGIMPLPTAPIPDPAGSDPSGNSSAGQGSGAGGKGAPGSGGHRTGAGGGGGKRAPGSAGGRPFISYVGVHTHEEDPDPDGLDTNGRLALEERAITLILASESELQRTPTHNPGYDLFETGEDDLVIKWVEVKAMTGGLEDRPVGISHTQFDCAREHGEAYWLYVVEHAGENEGARIVRIQDPAGKASTYTFDRGWLDVAETFDDTEANSDQDDTRRSMES